MVVLRFPSEEIVMTKIIKKTHPGTIIGIIVVSVMAVLTLLAFFFAL